MPKKVPDYSNSSIYKLVHKEDFDNENIYIGSTTNFIKRKNQHKSKCNYENNKDYNLKLYQYIRQNGGWDNWTMIQIQSYSCGSKKELETQERYWIEKLKSKLNNNIPTRTKVEYYYDNRDEKLEYHKKYYYDNRDENLVKRKQYYNDNKDKILEKGKEYRIDNKDKIAEKKKQYSIDNKGKIAEKNKKYYYDNHAKILESAKQYYYDNRDENLEKQKQYRIENKDKIAEKNKKYHIDNRDRLLEQKKEYYIDNRDKILEKIKQKVICDNCGCESTKGDLLRHKKSQKCINFNSK